MKISLRGWVVLGAFAACIAAAVWFGMPRVNAADRSFGSGSGQLTEQSLGNMLAAMGLKPEKTDARYDFTFRALHGEQEWNLSMSTVLSRDGESIWVMAWLDELPRSAAEVPRTALLRLLADNDLMGQGKFFAYIPANRRFVLQRVVPNRNLSTAAFRDVLRDLGSSVVETYPHWAVTNWKKGGSSEQAPNTGSGPGSKSRSAPPERQATQESSVFKLPVRR